MAYIIATKDNKIFIVSEYEIFNGKLIYVNAVTGLSYTMPICDLREIQSTVKRLKK